MAPAVSHVEKALVHLRGRYLSSVDDKEREIVRDKIQETSEDMAAEMGLLHLYKGPKVFDLDQLSEEELRPWKAYKTGDARDASRGRALPQEAIKKE